MARRLLAGIDALLPSTSAVRLFLEGPAPASSLARSVGGKLVTLYGVARTGGPRPAPQRHGGSAPSDRPPSFPDETRNAGEVRALFARGLVCLGMVLHCFEVYLWRVRLASISFHCHDVPRSLQELTFKFRPHS